MRNLLSHTLVAALVIVASAALTAQRVYKSDEPGVTLPKPTKQVKAAYPPEARAQQIEGTVVLDVVVRSDGKVGEVSVVTSIDPVYGIDEAAVKAMKQWEFEPGTKDGKPAVVRVQIRMSFKLR